MLNIACPICSTNCTLLNEEDKSISCPSCGNAIDISTVRPLETSVHSIQSLLTAAWPPDAERHRSKKHVELSPSDRFVSKRLLGQGGFASVYLAHDEELNRQVALKIPHEQFSSRTEMLQEARVAASLRHPGIVAVFDIVRADGDQWFLVTEFVEGETLAQILSKGVRLPATQVARLMAKVARALHHAHKNGVVHRDLKPSNILVNLQGEPVVSDFGLALHEDWQDKFRGNIAGTPCYMAPEQYRGEAHHFDGRTDEWAFGCVLYEVLTMRRPFNGDMARLREDICHRDPKPPRQRHDAIPRELEEICLKCLDKNVGQRFSTMLDVAESLEKWLEQQSAPSPQVTTPPPVRPRPRWGWALGGAGLVALVITIAMIAAAPAKPRDYRLPVELEMAPGRWHELPLPRTLPREVAFTRNLQRGHWQFLPDTHTVALDSNESGLIGFGVNSAKHFRLQVQMTRSRWIPPVDCGVFLGFQPGKSDDGRDGYLFQSVGLEFSEDGRAFVSRGVNWVYFTASGSHLISTFWSRDAQVDVHPFDDVVIEVGVANGQINSVKYQGRELPELVQLPPDDPYPFPECVGEFGVANSRGATRFHSFRMLVPRRSAP